MSVNMDKAVGTIQMVVTMIIKSIALKDYYAYDHPMSYESPKFPNFYVVINKLAISDKEETIEHYYTLAIVTPTHRYPIDVLDLVKTTTGIEYRFGGVRTPCVLNGEQYLSAGETDAMVRLTVNANTHLVKLIEEHNKGGRNELNKTRK